MKRHLVVTVKLQTYFSFASAIVASACIGCGDFPATPIAPRVCYDTLIITINAEVIKLPVKRKECL